MSLFYFQLVVPGVHNTRIKNACIMDSWLYYICQCFLHVRGHTRGIPVLDILNLLRITNVFLVIFSCYTIIYIYINMLKQVIKHTCFNYAILPTYIRKEITMNNINKLLENRKTTLYTWHTNITWNWDWIYKINGCFVNRGN